MNEINYKLRLIEKNKYHIPELKEISNKLKELSDKLKNLSNNINR